MKFDEAGRLNTTGRESFHSQVGAVYLFLGVTFQFKLVSQTCHPRFINETGDRERFPNAPVLYHCRLNVMKHLSVRVCSSQRGGIVSSNFSA